MKNPNNIYIGRRGIVFIDGERFPKKDSIWANPYKIDKVGLLYSPREEVIKKYKKYITKKLEEEISKEEFESLRGKTLGCWCKEKGKKYDTSSYFCHGDVLVELLK